MQGAGGVGGLLAVSMNGEYYFPCHDQNGNVVAYVDEIPLDYTLADAGEGMNHYIAILSRGRL